MIWYTYVKLADRSWGRPEDFFNSYYSKVYEKELLVSLDCLTYPWSVIFYDEC